MEGSTTKANILVLVYKCLAPGTLACSSFTKSALSFHYEHGTVICLTDTAVSKGGWIRDKCGLCQKKKKHPHGVMDSSVGLRVPFQGPKDSDEMV